MHEDGVALGVGRKKAKPKKLREPNVGGRYWLNWLANIGTIVTVSPPEVSQLDLHGHYQLVNTCTRLDGSRQTEGRTNAVGGACCHG